MSYQIYALHMLRLHGDIWDAEKGSTGLTRKIVYVTIRGAEAIIAVNAKSVRPVGTKAARAPHPRRARARPVCQAGLARRVPQLQTKPRAQIAPKDGTRAMQASAIAYHAPLEHSKAAKGKARVSTARQVKLEKPGLTRAESQKPKKMKLVRRAARENT